MKKLFNTIILVSILFTANAQVGIKYKSKNPKATDVLSKYNVGTKTCGASTFDVGITGQFLVFDALPNDKYAVLLINNDAIIPATNMAPINDNYCIDGSQIKSLFRPKGLVDHGVLAIPFKLRFDPVKIMAGGELGYYVGWRRGNFSLIGHAGLTTISLNDVNELVPETKLGFTYGAGVVYRLSDTFQIGLIEGQDLFEGVENWLYKYKPWFSLSVGFSFLKPNKDEVKQANTVR